MQLFCSVQEGLRKRKGNLTLSNDHRNAIKMIGFEIEQGEEVVTDNSKDHGFQKVVKFTSDLSQIITAGADGYFRVWEVCRGDVFTVWLSRHEYYLALVVMFLFIVFSVWRKSNSALGEIFVSAFGN